MRQIALPLAQAAAGPQSIVIGSANRAVAEALGAPGSWPYRTAILTGLPRSGKSLFARWFGQSGLGQAIDDARQLDETALFHRWNAAQESATALLIVGGEPPWDIALPDLRSRLGAALWLEIGLPDDEMAKELLLSMAAERRLALGQDAADYLIPRAGRSFVEIERLVDTIDRLSMERKVAPGPAIWRGALEEVQGPQEPRLI